jgi:hypothetical protein
LVLAVGPHGERLQGLLTMLAAGTAYALVLLVLGLLTPEDVGIASGALGNRWTGAVSRASALVKWLNQFTTTRSAGPALPSGGTADVANEAPAQRAA